MKYKNRITTGLGIIIVLGCVATVLMGKADWTQAAIGIAAGVGLMYAKDHNVK
jgi:hypothetical protein